MSTVASSGKSCPRHLTLAGQCEVQAKQGEKQPTFRLVANTGKQPMQLEGFFDPVVIDLEGARFAKDATPVIADHDTSKRIGHTTTQEIVPQRGIFATGIVSSASEAAQAFVKDSRSGFPFEASVGASVLQANHLEIGANAIVNGTEFTGPLIIARQVLIREISVTVLGGDLDTSAIAANSQSMEFSSMSQSQSLQTQRQNLAVEEERVDGIRAAASDFRFASIRQVALPNGEKLPLMLAKSKAIAEGMSVSDFELALFRSARDIIPEDAPGVVLNAAESRGTQVLECALAKHVNLPSVEKEYGEQVLEAAEKLGATSLYDIAKLTAKSVGFQGDWRSKDQVLRAAFSSGSLGTLLSNIATKQLEDAYRAFPSAAKIVAKKLSAENFKENTGVRLTGDNKFQKVAGDGELKHGTLMEDNYTYRLDTFGRMFGIDRQNIINDDLHALDTLPRILGRGAAIALEVEFWTLVLANTSSFFSTGNGNLISGGTSALTSGGVSLLVKKLLEQVDAEGHPINVVGKYLVVPPSLKSAGDELYVSKTLNVGAGSTTTDDRIPAENVHFGKYIPLVSPYIGINANRADQPAGASDDAYYLFGDPRDVAAFGIAYLDNREAPTIEENPLPFNLLGMQWRGYLDFGVCQIDHRGAAKAAGT